MKRTICIGVTVAALTTAALGQVGQDGRGSNRPARRSIPTARDATTQGFALAVWRSTLCLWTPFTSTPTSGKKPYASCAAG